MVSDLVDSLERQGIRKLVLLNGHGGNELKPLTRELHHRSKVFLCVCDWYRMARDVYPQIFQERLAEVAEASGNVLRLHAGCDFHLSYDNIQDAIEQQQAAKKTQEVLASLPEAYSIVLHWRYWEKRGLSEIARETGRTEKAIERLLARAREQFKRNWNER